MPVALIFLFGIANFAIHKAVLESGHPLIAKMPQMFGMLGGRFSLILEFLTLLGALSLANGGGAGWAWAYGFYSTFNAFSAWLILTRRL